MLVFFLSNCLEQMNTEKKDQYYDFFFPPKEE